MVVEQTCFASKRYFAKTIQKQNLSLSDSAFSMKNEKVYVWHVDKKNVFFLEIYGLHDK